MASKSSKVAVVIAVYNRETIWHTAVNSVLKQSQLPQAIIIVDDGSSDNTVSNINVWLEEHKGSKNNLDIKLIQQPHANASCARNRGLEFLQAYDYVLFLDSDDELPHDFIHRTCAKLDENEDVVTVSVPRASYNDIDVTCDDLTDFSQAPFEWMLYHGGAILSCSMFRRSALPAQGFDETMELGEDIILGAQVSLQGRWLVAYGLGTTFQRRTQLNQEDSQGHKNQSPITQLQDAHKHISATLQSIKARKQAVMLYNQSAKRKLSHSYWHYILSMWYRLAAKNQLGVARYLGKYFILGVMHWLLHWLYRSIDIYKVFKRYLAQI